jgi:hypothetical protein
MGHTNFGTTEIYAERDTTKAMEVMGEIG